MSEGFGSFKVVVVNLPYYNSDPKRDPNFDNHPSKWPSISDLGGSRAPP